MRSTQSSIRLERFDVLYFRSMNNKLYIYNCVFGSTYRSKEEKKQFYHLRLIPHCSSDHTNRQTFTATLLLFRLVDESLGFNLCDVILLMNTKRLIC